MKLRRNRLKRLPKLLKLPEIPRKVRRAKYEYFNQFDIIKRRFKMPERVCVLAPGFNAGVDQENAYERITADFVIAVGCAAEIPGVKIDMWLVTDDLCVSVAVWFRRISKSLPKDVIKCFSNWLCAVALPVPYICNRDKFYTVTMHSKAELDGVTYIPINGIFRADITVSGTAMRIAQLCGAKYIELCGVDMFGNRYYNGEDRKLPAYENKPLDSRDRLDSAIRWMREQGVEIVSLSTTALKEL